MGAASKDHDLQNLDIIAEHFAIATQLKLRSNITGRDVTTFAIGGVLRLFVEPENEAELSATLACLSQNNIRYRILGGGSNLLISDDGISDFVIRLGKEFRSFEPQPGGIVEVGAGTSLMRASSGSAELGLSGLEFAGGIPASIGGAVRMNAGAHGGEMSNVLQSLKLMYHDGTIETVDASTFNFSYRHSEIPKGAIVIGATFSLTISSKEICQEERRRHLAERKKRQPLTAASAGSVFKNPRPDLSAGQVLEAAQMKGKIIGGAEVSEMHANWIINKNKTAKAADVMALIKTCQNEAFSNSGVELVSEIIPWN